MFSIECPSVKANFVYINWKKETILTIKKKILKIKLDEVKYYKYLKKSLSKKNENFLEWRKEYEKK